MEKIYDVCVLVVRLCAGTVCGSPAVHMLPADINNNKQ